MKDKILNIEDLKQIKEQKILEQNLLESTTIGERIKAIRHKLNITQAELADKTGKLSRSFISRLEHEMFKLNYNAAKEIAVILNSIAKDKNIDISVSIEYLLIGREIGNIVPLLRDGDYYAFKNCNIEINKNDTYSILALRISELLKNKPANQAYEIRTALYYQGGDETRSIIEWYGL